MDDGQHNDDAITVLLSAADIPVPADEVGKIGQLARNATGARQALRALRLMETEPVTIVAPGNPETDGAHE